MLFRGTFSVSYTHNKNIYSKLGVKTRKELLQYIELMRNAEH